MSKEQIGPEFFHSYLPTDVEGIDSLAELALDMRWSWNHGRRRPLAPTRSGVMGPNP